MGCGPVMTKYAQIRKESPEGSQQGSVVMKMAQNECLTHFQEVRVVWKVFLTVLILTVTIFTGVFFISSRSFLACKWTFNKEKNVYSF